MAIVCYLFSCYNHLKATSFEYKWPQLTIDHNNNSAVNCWRETIQNRGRRSRRTRWKWARDTVDVWATSSHILFVCICRAKWAERVHYWVVNVNMRYVISQGKRRFIPHNLIKWLFETL